MTACAGSPHGMCGSNTAAANTAVTRSQVGVDPRGCELPVLPRHVPARRVPRRERGAGCAVAGGGGAEPGAHLPTRHRRARLLRLHLLRLLLRHHQRRAGALLCGPTTPFPSCLCMHPLSAQHPLVPAITDANTNSISNAGHSPYQCVAMHLLDSFTGDLTTVLGDDLGVSSLLRCFSLAFTACPRSCFWCFFLVLFALVSVKVWGERMCGELGGEDFAFPGTALWSGGHWYSFWACVLDFLACHRFCSVFAMPCLNIISLSCPRICELRSVLALAGGSRGAPLSLSSLSWLGFSFFRFAFACRSAVFARVSVVAWVAFGVSRHSFDCGIIQGQIIDAFAEIRNKMQQERRIGYPSMLSL
eukprot:3932038-Rhodomonas_salina.2